MTLTNTLYTLSTGAATALNAIGSGFVDLWIVPTTVIYIGGATTVTSSNGVTLTTAAPPFHIQLGPSEILYAGPMSSSAITVAVMTKSQ